MVIERLVLAQEYRKCWQCEGTGLVSLMRQVTGQDGPMAWGGGWYCHVCGGSGCVTVPVRINTGCFTLSGGSRL